MLSAMLTASAWVDPMGGRIEFAQVDLRGSVPMTMGIEVCMSKLHLDTTTSTSRMYFASDRCLRKENRLGWAGVAGSIQIPRQQECLLQSVSAR